MVTEVYVYTFVSTASANAQSVLDSTTTVIDGCKIDAFQLTVEEPLRDAFKSIIKLSYKQKIIS